MSLVKPAEGALVASDDDLARRFGGVSRLYGDSAAQAIAAAHVVIVGVGGVGSWATEALARFGVGQLTLIDLDHVAVSNINRQIQALDSTLGMAKVHALQSRIKEINVRCRVHGIQEFADAQNWRSLVPESANVVIDACDQVRAKTAIALWAIQQLDCGLVVVGAAGGKRDPTQTQKADLASVTHDPLLAKVRQQLRRNWREIQDGVNSDQSMLIAAKPRGTEAKVKQARLGIDCIFSREQVKLNESLTQGNLHCGGYGSSVAVTASFGMAAAAAAIEKICKKKP